MKRGALGIAKNLRGRMSGVIIYFPDIREPPALFLELLGAL